MGRIRFRYLILGFKHGSQELTFLFINLALDALQPPEKKHLKESMY
jgi:hypothetical protein